ncbi:MAG: V-type ATPase subunit, partial [Oscillospiraceae bacterium]|nr:V-type ATPase subunit [Oscillospiraceae bacterium]
MAKKKLKETDYIALSAMLRAREARLLGRDQLERMLSEGSFAEACRVAADAGYADMSECDAAGINAALAERYVSELAEVRDMLPDKSLLRILCLQYDCHNAKVLVK